MNQEAVGEERTSEDGGHLVVTASTASTASTGPPARRARSGRPGSRGDLFDPDCPTRSLLDRIGTKWVAMVVKLLAEQHPGELRFAELRRRMPGVSHKMLAQTLRNLGVDGLVERRVEDTVPPRVHYRLSDLGLSLDVPLAAVREWAEAHMAQIDEIRAGPPR